jgi:hypothetical protein
MPTSEAKQYDEALKLVKVESAVVRFSKGLPSG